MLYMYVCISTVSIQTGHLHWLQDDLALFPTDFDSHYKPRNLTRKKKNRKINNSLAQESPIRVPKRFVWFCTSDFDSDSDSDSDTRIAGFGYQILGSFGVFYALAAVVQNKLTILHVVS